MKIGESCYSRSLKDSRRSSIKDVFSSSLLSGKLKKKYLVENFQNIENQSGKALVRSSSNHNESNLAKRENYREFQESIQRSERGKDLFKIIGIFTR